MKVKRIKWICTVCGEKFKTDGKYFNHCKYGNKKCRALCKQNTKGYLSKTVLRSVRSIRKTNLVNF